MTAWEPETPATPTPNVPARWEPVGPPPAAGWAAPAAPAHLMVARSAPVTDQVPTSALAITVAWIVAIGTFGYMLPWAVAASRGKSNHGAIAVMNLLLGWTFIGWFAALFMACQAHQPVSAPNIVVTQNVAFGGVVAPAGWYSAPDGGGHRYWDGTTWTAHRAL